MTEALTCLFRLLHVVEVSTARTADPVPEDSRTRVLDTERSETPPEFSTACDHLTKTPRLHGYGVYVNSAMCCSVWRGLKEMAHVSVT